VSTRPAAAAVAAGPSAPEVNLAAFRGQGKLAFIWEGRLYVVDGTHGRLLQLTTSGQAADPAWSPDGTRLAFLHITDAAQQPGDLTLVTPDFKQIYTLGLPAPVRSFSWSPKSDFVAALLQGHAAADQPIYILPLQGVRYTVARSANAVVWAPDEQMLAYATTLPAANPIARGDALYTVPLTATAPALRYSAPGAGIDLAGWSPDGKALVFWRDPMHSASLAADGLDLYSLPLGGKPHRLALTLPYTDWLAWAPTGHTLVVAAGAGREAWSGKSLFRCDALQGICTTLPRQAGRVDLDPAWSPRGDRLAFVEAQALPASYSVGSDHSTQGSWAASRELWLADSHGGHARWVRAAGTGVSQPMWSADGSHILFVKDGTLQLISLADGRSVQILNDDSSTASMSGYFGHLWSSQLAWSRV
jgi:TolB protein